MIRHAHRPSTTAAHLYGCVCLLVLAGILGGCSREPDWTRTIHQVSSGVLTLIADHPRPFDGTNNLSTQGTGFVVDADRGLVLTNRHILGAGPSVVHAIFPNSEEVDLVPVYRDPVHDFAFLRYDPADLESSEPYEFPLVAEGAHIGREVKVIGSDAGERLSILSSTIARLDRNAPEYGIWQYNDFNTFYIQAASGTSPGSSGSPVIDIAGNAVALAAGSRTQSLSGYFLPLDRVVRAFELVSRGKPVTRGSLQTSLIHESFAELERLGLSEATRNSVLAQSPENRGMLVVKSVIPQSPAHGRLAVGDILVEVSGTLITDFKRLAEVLDEAVGQVVQVTVERAGVTHEAQMEVSDLHKITPREFVTLGGATLHALSYQQARHFGKPISGIYIADNEYLFEAAGVSSHSIILGINNQPTRDLDELEAVLETIPDGASANVRWIARGDPEHGRSSLVRFNRRWAAAKRCADADSIGWWTCRDLVAPASAAPKPAPSMTFRDWGSLESNRIARSLVGVQVDIPLDGIGGVWARRRQGTGLIVDAERGWVVTNRAVLPHAVADVRVVFDASHEVPASVEYVHPLHNLALVAYDPDLIASEHPRSANLDSQSLAPGVRAYFAGLRADDSLMYRPALVESVEPIGFSRTDQRVFRGFNVEVVSLVDAPREATGVLLDEAQQRVLALWVPWHGFRDEPNAGIAAEVVMDMIAHLHSGEPLRSLEVQWSPLPLSDTRLLSLPEHWIEAYAQHDPQRRRILKAQRILKGDPAVDRLREGDLLLAIDGELANSYREVERLSQNERVRLTILRDRQVLDLDVATLSFDGRGVEEVVRWAGAYVIEPYRALSFDQGIEPFGVYSTLFFWGSPAGRETLANRRILALNDISTPDLASFVEAARSLEGRVSVRVKTLDSLGRPSLRTIRLDPHYWPLEVLRRSEHGWILESLE